MMIPSDTNRSIDDEQYPLTTAEFVERYGDRTFTLQNGSESVADIVGRQADEVYTSPDEVRMALYNGVSHEAVGRRFYSDRDPTPPGSPVGPEQLSF